MKIQTLAISVVVVLFLFAMSIFAAPDRGSPSPAVQASHVTDATAPVPLTKDAAVVDFAIVDESPIGNFAEIQHESVDRLDKIRPVAVLLDGCQESVDHVPLY